MEKRGKRIRFMAAISMAATVALMISMIIGGIYLLQHPEVFGWFARRVVAGYEERQP